MAGSSGYDTVLCSPVAEARFLVIDSGTASAMPSLRSTGPTTSPRPDRSWRWWRASKATGLRVASSGASHGQC